MHLKDFTEWNAFTIIVPSIIGLFILALIANRIQEKKDRKRHDALIARSNETAEKAKLDSKLL